MKKSVILITFFVFLLQSLLGQAYREDFENFNVGDYLGAVSPLWTTMSGSTGGSEDIQINDSNSNSGKNSIFYDSPNGGGPQNIVMPFNLLLNSGKFKFSTMFFVPSGNQAAFSFQNNTILGSTNSMEFFLFDNGTFDVNGLTGGYPADRWFEVRIEVDFDANSWDVFVDNRFQGSFSSRVNSISHFNLFGPNPNSSFWMDDLSYCVKNACNPDIAMRSLTISSNPICSNYKSDVTLSLTNHGPDVATGFELAILMPGQATIRHRIVLDSLAAGRDTVITVSKLFKTNISGRSLEVIAINSDHDANLRNDSATTRIDVNSSPYGASLIKDTVFQGVIKTGRPADPDLLETGKTNTYVLTPPTSSSNSAYDIDWKISSVVAKTSFGVIIPANNYQFSFPSNTGNGKLRITGKDIFIDSTITFIFTLQNLANTCDSLVQRSVMIVPVPKVEFVIPDTVCARTLVAFENKTSIHSGQTTNMWYFGDGDSSDNTNPFHAYSVPGAYRVKLVVRNFPHGFVRDTFMTLQVVEKPEVKFTAKNQCEGEPLIFSNLSNVGNGSLKYVWDFGDNTPLVNSVNPQHLYDTAGSYKVLLTASANGCAVSFSRAVFQFPIPKVDFAEPSSGVCADVELVLPNLTNIASGLNHPFWNFGDGMTSNLHEGKHIYKTSGTYAVKLISVSDFGCMDSVVKNINVLRTPSPSFTADRYCDGKPTLFMNNSTNKSLPIVHYKWVVSDGFTSFQNNLRYTWSGAGKYKVTLNALNINGCSGSVTEEIEVLPQPNADFNSEDICLGEEAIFENLSKSQTGDIEYFWDFGNTNSSQIPAPRMQYDLAGEYSVQLVASYKNTCRDTMERIIVVNDTPTCNFNYTNNGNMKFGFTPTDTGYAQYKWLFGDGSISNNMSPEYTYSSGGSYSVTMTAANAAGCTCELVKTIYASTGVNSINNLIGVDVNPNPNNGSFTVKYAGSQYFKVQVFNSLGRKIYDQSTDNGILIVDITDNEPGVYLVNVTIAGLSYTTKIVVTD